MEFTTLLFIAFVVTSIPSLIYLCWSNDKKIMFCRDLLDKCYLERSNLFCWNELKGKKGSSPKKDAAIILCMYDKLQAEYIYRLHDYKTCRGFMDFNSDYELIAWSYLPTCPYGKYGKK